MCEGAWRCPACAFVALVAHTSVVQAGADVSAESIYRYTGDPGTGSIVERRRRLFVQNSTGPQAFRPGLRYPRADARMLDGDEVQLYSGPHQTWLSAAAAPPAHVRGMVTLKGGRYHKYCSLQGARIDCSLDSASRVHLELRDAGWGGRVALVAHGKLCSDTAGGLTCTKPVPPGHIAGWEAMRLLDAGNGWVAFKGGRAGKYCADTHRGIVCNRDRLDGWEMFQVQGDDSPATVLVQTKDRAQASTFRVGRSKRTSSEITLRCRDSGLYVKVDPRTKAMACSSRSPATLNFHRIHGREWWSAAKGAFQDPSTGKYLKADGPQWGGHVKATGGDAGGWQLLDVHLTAGYEDVYPLVRGVNLGSWFVLEKWMVDDLFKDHHGNAFTDSCAALDEYGLMSRLQESTKRSRLEAHWSTWITEDDIRWMAGHGLNTVRVPFGYWMTHPEPPFIDGQFKYMEKLFTWCEKYSMAVLLDFHGLKGSQNGAQTSGNCGACGRKGCGTTWKRFLDHQDTNLAAIERMVSHFSKSPAYFGFGIANEVAGSADGHGTMAFYQKAYDIIRRYSPDCLVFMDSTFNPSTYPFRGEASIAQDDHMYFSAKFRDSASHLNVDNLEKARGRQLKIERWQLLIGEWALNHHGHPLGGYTRRERGVWNGEFARAQLQAFEQHSMGWIYWSYKTQYYASTWNFRYVCEEGWLPGCGRDYAPDNWFDRHPCSYAYLEPSRTSGGCGPRVISV